MILFLDPFCFYVLSLFSVFLVRTHTSVRTSCVGLVGCCVLSFVRHQHHTLSKRLFVPITHLQMDSLFSTRRELTIASPQFAHTQYIYYIRISISLMNAATVGAVLYGFVLGWCVLCSIRNGRWYPRSNVLFLAHVGDTCLRTILSDEMVPLNLSLLLLLSSLLLHM